MIFESLGFPQLDDPIAALHDAVTTLSEQYPVEAQDGSRLEPLFNTFVVSDNPMWKDK